MSSMDKDAIPIRLRALDITWLTSLAVPEQHVLRWIYNFIDGRRSIAQIKRQFSRLPEDKIEQAIIFLMATHYITLKE
ncbi:hypothetical protein KSC_109910 [Ktedonobacter sp. SOSP1-52]|nr:hypothetical protein KSC_109910 [Ktedonobacter sp. SOSP1-52]